MWRYAYISVMCVFSVHLCRKAETLLKSLNLIITAHAFLQTDFIDFSIYTKLSTETEVAPISINAGSLF